MSENSQAIKRRHRVSMLQTLTNTNKTKKKHSYTQNKGFEILKLNI